MQKAEYGLIIGKFCPLHQGHALLINQAAAQVEQLWIVVCGSSKHPFSLTDRQNWLEQSFPQHRILTLDQDQFDDQSQLAWVQALQPVLPPKGSLYFTSESYGENYATLLGMQHRAVDPDRVQVPISATQIMDAPERYLEYVLPAAQANVAQFAKRNKGDASVPPPELVR